MVVFRFHRSTHTPASELSRIEGTYTDSSDAADASVDSVRS
jgi:hypothetical protein